VEEALGRIRTERWGARTIDVDVLLYDDEIVDAPDLIVPHPRMTERAFVVLPLLELEPDLALPDGRRLKDLRLEISGAEPFAPPLAVDG
jgi:2-amino-4-hydroxy-6-hydroxymethyldihydropteridine diphosphokinase